MESTEAKQKRKKESRKMKMSTRKNSPKVAQAPLTRKPTSADRGRVARQAAWDAAIEDLGMRVVCQIAMDWAEYWKNQKSPLEEPLPEDVYRMARPRTRLKPLPVVESCFWIVMKAWVINSFKYQSTTDVSKILHTDFSGLWREKGKGYMIAGFPMDWQELEEFGTWTTAETGEKHVRQLCAADVTISLTSFERYTRKLAYSRTSGYFFPTASLTALKNLESDYEALKSERDRARDVKSEAIRSVAA